MIVVNGAVLLFFILDGNFFQVTPRKRFTCAQCHRNDSLWSESSHFIKRSECLSVFTKHFNNMPLKPVEFRADPVLYQENVPLDMMAYPDIGIV